MSRDGKDFAKFLFCLGILEGKAFQLYGRISEKVESPHAKFSLLYIAYDCLKNSVILGELSKSLARPEVKDKDYGKILGDVWKIVENLSREILKLESIDKKKFLSLSNKLIAIYTITLAELKTLAFMRKEISAAYNVGVENLKDILELVIEDEETDTQVLMSMKDSYAGKDRGAVGTLPEVKYVNPEAWNRSETG